MDKSLILHDLYIFHSSMPHLAPSILSIYLSIFTIWLYMLNLIDMVTAELQKKGRVILSVITRPKTRVEVDASPLPGQRKELSLNYSTHASAGCSHKGTENDRSAKDRAGSVWFLDFAVWKTVHYIVLYKHFLQYFLWVYFGVWNISHNKI